MVTFPIFLQFVEFSAVGLVAGCLAGLVGIGGGIVIVPVLSLLYGYYGHDSQTAARMSVVTSLAAVFLIAAHTTFFYLRTRLLSVRAAGVLLTGGFFGSLLGISLGFHTDSRLVFVALALLLGFFGGQMLLSPGGQQLRLTAASKGSRAPNPRREAVRRFVTGIVSGVVSALFGIGGGLVAVPLQVFSGASPLQAARDSAALVAVTSCVGTIGYVVGSHVLGEGGGFFGPLQIHHAILIGFWGIVGARGTIAFTQRLPVHIVNIATGCVYIAVALLLVAREVTAAL